MSDRTNDDSTSIASLKTLVAGFVADRQWELFHTPKNLATCICIEAAELAEHFQWLTPEQSAATVEKIGNDHPIAQELADVLAYVLAMANTTGIDLSEALRSKMKQNARKYPIPNLSETDTVERDDESNFPNMDGG